MPKKLRLSVNNPQVARERPLSPSVYVTTYHWPRIIGAGLVLLGILVALYFWAASDDDTDEDGLASDGDVVISTPAATDDAEQSAVFVEPGTAQSQQASSPEADPSATEGARTQRSVPVPRDTSRESAFSSDRPLAESLSDQVHERPAEGRAASVLAPESETERAKYRLTVQDEPVRKPVAPSASAPPRPKGPSPEGLMTVQSDKVVRAVITDEILNSAPTTLLKDPIKVRKGRQTTIHLFTEVRDSEGETLTLSWFHAGKAVLTLPLTVRTQKAVVTSSVAIASSQAGAWQVEIRDEAGQALAAGHFQVTIQ